MLENVVFGRRSDGTVITGKGITSVAALSRARVLELKKISNPRAVNAAIMMACTMAAWMWIRVFLPKRFDPIYAKSVLGYKAKKSYEEDKRRAAESGDPYRFRGRQGREFGDEVMVQSPQPTPFVLTGSSKTDALTKAKPKVSVMSDGTFTVMATVPRGRINQTRQNYNFGYVPAIEQKRVSDAILRYLETVVVPGIQSGQIDKNFMKKSIQRTIDNHQERVAK